MMKRHSIVAFTAIATLITTNAKAQIIDGGFEDAALRSGAWQTDGKVDYVVQPDLNTVAQLYEPDGTSGWGGVSRLYQEFVWPDPPNDLSFRYKLVSDSAQANSSVLPDGFQVFLFDNNGSPISPSSFSDAYFYRDSNDVIDYVSGGSVQVTESFPPGWRKVVLITGGAVTAGTTATLEFGLAGMSNGVTTTVEIDAAAVTCIPNGFGIECPPNFVGAAGISPMFTGNATATGGCDAEVGFTDHYATACPDTITRLWTATHPSEVPATCLQVINVTLPQSAPYFGCLESVFDECLNETTIESMCPDSPNLKPLALDSAVKWYDDDDPTYKACLGQNGEDFCRCTVAERLSECWVADLHGTDSADKSAGVCIAKLVDDLWRDGYLCRNPGGPSPLPPPPQWCVPASFNQIFQEIVDGTTDCSGGPAMTEVCIDESCDDGDAQTIECCWEDTPSTSGNAYPDYGYCMHGDDCPQS